MKKVLRKKKELLRINMMIFSLFLKHVLEFEFKRTFSYTTRREKEVYKNGNTRPDQALKIYFCE